MLLQTRILTYCVTGLLAGLALWFPTELLIPHQADFPEHISFRMTAGAILGAVMGFFIGANKGILSKNLPKLRSGIITGFFLGIPAGSLAFLLGMGVLWIMGSFSIQAHKEFLEVGIPFSNVTSWGLFGMFTCATVGIRSFSKDEIINNALAGFLGGIIGGMAIEALRFYFPDFQYSRLLGLLVFGGAIGYLQEKIERNFSSQTR